MIWADNCRSLVAFLLLYDGVLTDDGNQRLTGVGGHPMSEWQTQGSALEHPATRLES